MPACAGARSNLRDLNTSTLDLRKSLLLTLLQLLARIPASALKRLNILRLPAPLQGEIDYSSQATWLVPEHGATISLPCSSKRARKHHGYIP